MRIRTRIAPSPTGPLHIGTVRTALFSWLFARQHDGEFILRIEDTDLERSDPRFEKDIVEGLKWLGIVWDNEKLYRQSERTSVYEAALNRLLTEKKAFYCPHTEEELAAERQGQMERREAPRHVCDAREGKAAGGIIRLKNDFQGEIKFNDMIRGEISFAAELLGDFSLAKSPTVPLYNFAVVVDDHEMEISHVIRGEDHIPNTPKQMLIQRALGIEPPQYAHLPLILGKDRSKMSKRHGGTSISEYRKDGYLPAAMVNFIALLGWHPQDDREIFSLDELVREFSFERVQKGGAVFDSEKLDWVNKEYIKSLDVRELYRLAQEFFPEEWRDAVEKRGEVGLRIIQLERERIVKLSELASHIDYFFNMPFYAKDLLRWKDKEDDTDILRHLEALLPMLEKIGAEKWNADNLSAAIMPYAEREGRGNVLWPMRVALCGRRNSPGPFEIAAILGKDEVLERLKRAIGLLRS